MFPLLMNKSHLQVEASYENEITDCHTNYLHTIIELLHKLFKHIKKKPSTYSELLP